MKNFIFKPMRACTILMVAVFSFTGMSCSDDVKTGDNESPYLRLSQYDVSFAATQADAVRINVETNQPIWSADSEDLWIDIDEQNGYFNVSVKENDGEEREGEVIVTAGAENRTLKVLQSGVGEMQVIFHEFDDITQPLFMSRNGKYAYTTGFEGEEEITAILVNMETFEYTRFTNAPYGALNLWGINDLGHLVGTADMDTTDETAVTYIDGVWTKLPLGTYDSSMGQSISDDGTIVVGGVTRNGYMDDDDEWVAPFTYPAVWRAGTLTVLPIPERDAEGEEWSNGIVARGVSGDGSIIYGEELGTLQAVYWKNGEYHYVAPDKTETVTFTVYDPFLGFDLEIDVRYMATVLGNRDAISQNGRYISGGFARAELVEGETLPVRAYFPYLFDTETGTTTIIESTKGAEYVLPLNDGSMLYSTNTYIDRYTRTGYVVDAGQGAPVLFNDWISDRFDIEVSNDVTITGAANNKESVSAFELRTNGSSLSYHNWVVKRIPAE